MKLKMFYPTVAVLCLFIAQLKGIIVEAPNLDGFEKAVQSGHEKSLVLFDVDETLIVPKDIIFLPHGREIWNKYSQMTIKNPAIVSPEQLESSYFLSRILSQIQYEIVDPKILQIIDKLQNRKIKTIAFTKMVTGPLGVIPSMEDWRLEHLRMHGMDFSKAFSHFPSIHLEELESSGRSALFKEGILCANKQDKGPVLVSFLNAIGWKPDQIFFLDNRMDYLQSVEDSLKGTGIEFIGFHYTHVEDQPQVVNEKLAEFQMMHLAKTGIWLSDPEASKLLQN